MEKLPGIKTPKTQKNCTHSFYIYAILVDESIIGVKKKYIYKTLVAEGLDNLLDKYFNLHLLPMYQNKFAYGTKGFPWNSKFSRKNINYKKGICPNAEKLNNNSLLFLELCVHDYSNKEVNLVIKCFRKVWKSLNLI